MSGIKIRFAKHYRVLGFRIFSRSTSEGIEKVHWAPEILNVKEFFKNIHSFLASLSFKLTNHVASFTQSANDNQEDYFIVCCYLLTVQNKPPDW